MRTSIPIPRPTRPPRHHNGAKAQRGAALMEAVLWAALVLVPLLLAMAEASRALADYRLIVQQVQAAARFLSTQEPGQGHAQARCIFLTGYPSVDCSSAPLLPGFEDASFSLQIQDASNSPQHRAQRSAALPGAGAAVNLVSVQALGYRHRVLHVDQGPLAALGSVGYAPIAATFRQMD